MNNAIQTVNYTLDNGQEISLSPETVVNHLVSGQGNVTAQEVKMFLELCKYQRINPFLKEAYLIKFGSRPAEIVIGKELFTKRAENHEQYNGIKAGVVVYNEKDGELVEREGSMVVTMIGEVLVGGWAEIHRKDQEIPIKAAVSLDEYIKMKDGQPSSTWAKMPATMIRKVALMQALREAFPNTLGGMYAQEEVGIEDDSNFGKEVIEQPEVEQEIYLEKIHFETMLKVAEGDKELCKQVSNDFGYDDARQIKLSDFAAICDAIKLKVQLRSEKAEIIDAASVEESGFDIFGE